MRKTFLSLSPKEGVTYSLFSLTIYGTLTEMDTYESSGAAIVLKDDGEVYISNPVIVDNTFVGKREPLELVTD